MTGAERNQRASNFASMDPQQHRAIASMDGRAAHRLGVAHEFTSEEAKAAGAKSGKAAKFSPCKARSAAEERLVGECLFRAPIEIPQGPEAFVVPWESGANNRWSPIPFSGRFPMHRNVVFALLVGLLVGADKYKKDWPKAVSVEGTVTLDGQPLANATVLLVPLEKGARATGTMTDEKGQYKLATPGNKAGIRPGKYKVMIAKNVFGKSVLPARYSSVEKTLLVCEVAEGKNTIDFDLKSK
jgi:hypothetical protein